MEKDNNNFKYRVIAAIILLVPTIYSIYFCHTLFLSIIIVTVIMAAFEWHEITSKDNEFKWWKFIGLFYLGVPAVSIIYLKNMSNGSDLILWLLTIVWGTDVASYFVGKKIGGPKLTSISPNKTWSGLLGGILVATIIGALNSFIFKGSLIFFAVAGCAMAIIEQISDIIESKIKRRFEIKDSGNIIPGHGGILDRIDGIILTAPTALAIFIIFNDKF